MLVTVDDIIKSALLPHQTHAKLSRREGEMITESITAMLINGYCLDLITLRFMVQFYTREDWQRLIWFRNQNDRCGYPLCKNHLNGELVDLNTLGSLYSYCNSLHMDCDNFIKSQLSEVPIADRDSIHIVNNIQLQQQLQTQIPGQIQQTNPFQIQLLEDIIKDKTTEYNMDEIIDSLNKFDLKR